MIKVSIAENLEEVEKRISAAAKRSGRKREDITLVAVTKTHPAEMMNEAIKLGVTDIGENKPQEVRDKYDSVLPVKWHLIGHLQTNKVKYVIDKVCLIHSVDSIKLMDEIERQAEKPRVVEIFAAVFPALYQRHQHFDVLRLMRVPSRAEVPKELVARA